MAIALVSTGRPGSGWPGPWWPVRLWSCVVLWRCDGVWRLPQVASWPDQTAHSWLCRRWTVGSQPSDCRGTLGRTPASPGQGVNQIGAKSANGHISQFWDRPTQGHWAARPRHTRVIGWRWRPGPSGTAYGEFGARSRRFVGGASRGTQLHILPGSDGRSRRWGSGFKSYPPRR